MYCGNCGKYVADEAKFCGHCGSPVSTNRNAGANNSIQNSTDGYTRGGSRRNSSMNTGASSNKKTIIFAAIAILLLGGVFIAFKGSGSNSSPNYNEPVVSSDDSTPNPELSDNVTCPLCNGSKTNTHQGVTADCYLCKGNGILTKERYDYVKNTSDKCPWCQGGCYDANGDICRLCNGNGSLTILEYAFRIYGDGKSSGGGSNSEDDGSGSHSNGRTGCPHCQCPGAENVAGNGTCDICKGTGRTSGYGVELSACNQCDQVVNGRGNGKCRWCHGTGWR